MLEPQVMVNGTVVTVNRSDLGDLLEPGKNKLIVGIATTLFNAVRAGGDSDARSPTGSAQA